MNSESRQQTTRNECPCAFFNDGHVVYRTDVEQRPIQPEHKFDFESGEPQYPLLTGFGRGAFPEAWEAQGGAIRAETSRILTKCRVDVNALHPASYRHEHATPPAPQELTTPTTYLFIGVRTDSCRAGPERDNAVRAADSIHALLLEKGFDVPCLVCENTTWP
ncbi:hypothetical protein MIND_00136500 [Mycena indigotica]|uniref:Uncharacterized protein n=1 Tax=Mycena indigotica TaxID=2126181 RepID=A0A8H6TCQ9_9AGAR|nr:uncharacterized protein MIND_00136500 [Mycena indigotica]KAF7316183.1 hypothetical protein MIND_00136500 [Mycena indigotica]